MTAENVFGLPTISTAIQRNHRSFSELSVSRAKRVVKTPDNKDSWIQGFKSEEFQGRQFGQDSGFLVIKWLSSLTLKPNP